MVHTLWRLTSVITISVFFVVIAVWLTTMITKSSISNVHDNGMAPVLRRGDLIIATPAPIAEVGVGDIVAYTSASGSQLTVRRVVGTPQNLGIHSFEVKGNGAQPPAPLVSETAVAGRVTYAVPLMGYIYDFARSPLGIVLFICLPALLLAAYELRRVVGYYRRDQEYTAEGYDHQHTPHPYHHVHLVR